MTNDIFSYKDFFIIMITETEKYSKHLMKLQFTVFLQIMFGNKFMI